MLELLLKNSNEVLYKYDDLIMIDESWSIQQIISESERVRSELLLESSIALLDSNDIMLEAAINFDMDVAVFLNEGILGAIIKTIKKIVATAYGFIKQLSAKVSEFTDQFTLSNENWYKKYAKKVAEKESFARGFKYTGHKWDLRYATASMYPSVTADIMKQGASIEKSVSEFNSLASSGPNDRDIENINKNLKSTFKEGFKGEYVEKMEKKLGCKINEISKFFYEKATGGEKEEISAFSAVSLTNMMEHVRTSHTQLKEVDKQLKEVLEVLNGIYDIIDKIKAEDLDDKAEKVSNNESVMSLLGIGSKRILNEAKKNEPPSKDEVDKEIEAKNKEKEKLDLSKKDTRTPEEKESATKYQATKYTTELKNVLTDAISTWNTAVNIQQKLNGVRVRVIQDANKEFIRVLTKFMNSKSGGDE